MYSRNAETVIKWNSANGDTTTTTDYYEKQHMLFTRSVQPKIQQSSKNRVTGIGWLA